MNSEYIEIEEITQLELSTDYLEKKTGNLLAKHFETLLKREGSQLQHLKSLRTILQRLPAGHPLRRKIAKAIYNHIVSHQAAALRAARRLITDTQSN